MLSDIEEGVLCGNYEKETAEMLKKAFANSKHAYDVEKVVEQLVTIHVEGHCPSESLECVLNKTCDDCYREIVTEIVRKGGVE